MDIDNLSTEEQNSIHALPFYVAILIASADGNIDAIEVKRAFSIINMKTKMPLDPGLTRYYNFICEDFEDKLKIILSQSPNNKKERQEYFTKRIAQANIALNKLEPLFVTSLHNSLRDMAKQIAKASGGILGYGSIGREESGLIDLHFLKLPSFSRNP